MYQLVTAAGIVCAGLWCWRTLRRAAGHVRGCTRKACPCADWVARTAAGGTICCGAFGGGAGVLIAHGGDSLGVMLVAVAGAAGAAAAACVVAFAGTGWEGDGGELSGPGPVMRPMTQEDDGSDALREAGAGAIFAGCIAQAIETLTAGGDPGLLTALLAVATAAAVAAGEMTAPAARRPKVD